TFASSSSRTSKKDSTKPTATIDTPSVGSLVNVGDSIYVTLTAHDDRALGSVAIEGITEHGSKDLGTFTQSLRYSRVTVPPGGTFRPGLKDTTVRRYLKPVSATDTTLDSLKIRAIVTDSAGNVDTVTTRINLVSGPHVFI